MSIVTKEEADNHPVGEAQEEPNINPRLEKPTEGRGIKAFLAGTFIDPSKWALPNFGLFYLLQTALLMGAGILGLTGIVLMAKFV